MTGEVDSFFARAFTIGDSTWGDELPIVAADGASIPRSIRLRQARPHVRISGTVRIDDGRVDLVAGAEPLRRRPYVEAGRIEVLG